MLNPFRYGLVSWQLASHKLCRWLVPFAMIVAFLSNVLLVSRSDVYLAAFVVQVGWYAAALGGAWTGIRALRIPFFLVLANLAILTAWLRYARGERITVWHPSERMRVLPQASSR
jgi:hypothetical protein